MRRIAAITLLVPKYPSFGKRPWHIPIVELHLLGIERTMFRPDFVNTFSSDRYNYVVGVEMTARKLGLISTISLN